jgi:hypothetical protein
LLQRRKLFLREQRQKLRQPRRDAEPYVAAGHEHRSAL